MAILLLLVFTIPVVYQSSHVLLYHSDDAQCCTLGKNEARYYFDNGELNQHCVIAEYTFTHKDLPADQPIVSANLSDKETFNFYTHPGYQTFKLNQKSPRAPPVS